MDLLHIACNIKLGNTDFNHMDDEFLEEQI